MPSRVLYTAPPIGTRFGRLVVVGAEITSADRERKAPCRCDCGAETTPTIPRLHRGLARSCGRCVLSAANLEAGRVPKPDSTPGTRFGGWEVVAEAPRLPTSPTKRRLQVRCATCGAERIAFIGDLRRKPPACRECPEEVVIT